jgi:MFS family permease
LSPVQQITPAGQSLRRDLRAITADGVAFSLMVGAGETYLPAFVLALGLGEINAGLVVSLPLLAGAFLQLVSPAAIRRLRSHRRWVVACAAAQGLSFVPLLAAALAGRMPAWVVFLIATLYWGAGMATSAAWNTWVGTLVRREIRARFFALRSRLCQAAVLLGVVGGGLALHYGEEHGQALAVFAALFGFAGACRLASAGFLALQSEPRPAPDNHRDVSVPELLRRVRHSSDGRLLLYLLVVQAAVQISGPYFTPYMLAQVKFSYGQYLLLISTSYAAKTLAFPVFGALAGRFGSQRLLYVFGAAIVPLSALWLVSDSLAWLLVVQVVAGIAWAGYELTTFLLLFDRIAESERTSILTTYYLGHAVATVAGATLGAVILKSIGPVPGAYMVLFALSCAARVGAVAFLARLHGAPAAPVQIAPDTLAVRPNTGSMSAPLVLSEGGNGPNAGDEGEGRAGPTAPGPRPRPAPVSSAA